MKKRLLAGLLAAAMLTGLGSVVFAEGESISAEITTTGTYWEKEASAFIEGNTLKLIGDKWSYSNNADECKGHFVPIAVTISGVTEDNKAKLSVKAESATLGKEKTYELSQTGVLEDDGETMYLIYRVADGNGTWLTIDDTPLNESADQLALTLYSDNTVVGEPAVVSFSDLQRGGIDDVTFTAAYVKLVNPKYWVDANGYLHFTTSQGNYVVVTDAPLVRK